MNDEGKVSESNQETACIQNNFFASVFEKEEDEELPDFMEGNYSQPLESLIFTEEQVSKVIDRIKASKSQGPDNIHPKMIKETKSAIKTLNLLFTFVKSVGPPIGHRPVNVKRAVVVMDGTLGPFFKPEKNLEFFRLKNGPRDAYPGKLE